MSKRIAAVGLGVAVACATANAQDLAIPSRIATIDAAGRVLPGQTARPHIAAAGAAVTLPCAPAKAISTEEAKALVARIAAEEAFSSDFVQSVAKNESQYNSIALSDKGAFGLMQLLPQTADRFKVDLCDPAGNVRGGVRFLRSLLDKYKNPFFVLAAYNAGEEAVAKSRGVPPYPETVRFVAQVVNDVYGWPGLAPQRGAAGALAAAQADVVEVAPKDERPRPAAGKPPGKGEWSDGFVMHVD
jgi:soluble lytic murein transglycosylase-like protein